MSSTSGGSGADQIASASPSGGTSGTFTLTDLPAASGSDSLNVLGDTPNDNMQVVQDINGRQTTFTNREYVGQIADGSGVVARAFSTARGEYIYFMYSDESYEPDTPITYSTEAFALCFVSSTRILTTRGAIAVEDLQIGDTAVTASGRHRPITWIGQRQLGSDSRPMPADQAPVQIRAGAFGPGLPARDLFLSPGHPVLVGADADGQGGVLVPVMCLINGTSIARTDATSVVYWHVELDAHDILLAEGLPAESFLDFGCRPFFEGASDHALHNPDFVPPGLAGRCRPVAVDGPLVKAERARLDALFVQALTDHCAWAEGAENNSFA
ncbi:MULTISPECIES: Hint domain-containing protein [Methylorubrum]|uniref:Hint domain-containing protein n=1 Tax=Methylorubrum TaxID=2282523 RepID=UPI0020A02162|nr:MULTISPECIES: Hint domain-containing protein [Methylorubrum]MCP1547314.1 hypothetical protein [Methylorubrum zatmanii]MCP1556070.1 hypothetical protein [Methylorubrum extorquens]MCP1577617.1 hypothetical protein [Methylorubrum extorquens]